MGGVGARGQAGPGLVSARFAQAWGGRGWGWVVVVVETHSQPEHLARLIQTYDRRSVVYIAAAETFTWWTAPQVILGGCLLKLEVRLALAARYNKSKSKLLQHGSQCRPPCLCTSPACAILVSMWSLCAAP